MRIGRVHQRQRPRVVPKVVPHTVALPRYDFMRAHHEGAALLAAWATSAAIALLVLAAALGPA
ncbi:hypothetical protein HNR00_000875 [Methylorubrum rhodinum]|uniref:Uncharacterized protein n=1 Tax=Methylorubrum rhodinum TaxID=29428 RepID=A0A840ZEQ4_9HYPH|nr:hypothetical protein [Methylorubrum rhodinum]MBB5756179.1 hypothetical protein [Methylorubrum rhodinum]